MSSHGDARSVKILNAAIDEIGAGSIILRGVIDPDSLSSLQVADYQREVLPSARIGELMRAMKKGSSVPDVVLGMRGGDYTRRGDVHHLHSPVFIIDGLQRVTAGRKMLEEAGEKDKRPHIGAMIHFDTTVASERELFRILNSVRTKLSPNVLIRNLRHNNPAIMLLYRACNEDGSFTLHERVSWDQRVHRTHIMTALALCKVAGAIHAHIGPGRSNHFEELARGLARIMEKVGPNIFRDNVKMFFAIVDECWGVRRVVFKDGAAHMRGNFLGALATLFSRHDIFWRGNRLFVEADLKKKIASFPVTDPSVKDLASAGGVAQNMLLQLMIDHVNRGKRGNRLVSREPKLADGEEDQPAAAVA